MGAWLGARGFDEHGLWLPVGTGILFRGDGLRVIVTLVAQLCEILKPTDLNRFSG